MDPFLERLQQWQMFYATLATACATLTGLLFVALSLNLDILNLAENTERMWLARQTFSEFLLVLMVALVFLIPEMGPLGLGVALLSLCLAWTLSTARAMRVFAETRKPRTGVADFLRAFGLALFGAAGVGIVAVCMLLELTGALYGLVFMLAALLASASRNAWSLLVEVRSAGGTSAK